MATKSAKKSAPGKTGKSVYDIVTERILNLLDEGVAPWRRPWRCSRPMNGASGRPYRGLNALLLGLAPFGDPRWFTFKEIAKRGGRLKEGAKSSLVTYWKWDKPEPGAASAKPGEPVEDREDKRGPLLRYYLVFNAEQVEGLALPPLASTVIDSVAEADALVAAYQTKGGPRIDFTGDRAAYSPLRDRIVMPFKESFNSGPAFYGTLFHELGHSTGHSSRLGRLGDVPAAHGSDEYGQEELVAEFFATFTAAHVGMGLDSEVERNAAYIAAWKEIIQADKRLVIRAAGAAQKALDHFLGVEPYKAAPAEAPEAA